MSDENPWYDDPLGLEVGSGLWIREAWAKHAVPYLPATPGAYARTASVGPTFDGQAVFGDPARFVSHPLPWPSSIRGATPATVDSWLGLAPGTTTTEPGSDRLWGVSGAFLGSEASVLAGLAAPRAFAGIGSIFGRPTGDRWPASLEFRRGCHFVPGELAASPPSSSDGVNDTLSYLLVIRDAGWSAAWMQ